MTEDCSQERKLEGVAALMIDMQPCYLRSIGIEEIRRIWGAQLLMLEFLRMYSVPIAVLEVEKHRKTIKELREEVTRFPEECYDFFVKPGMDGFADKRLEDRLRGWHATDLILMGVYAADCVKSTAIGAEDRGFRVHTARPLISDIWSRGGDYERQVLSWYGHAGRHIYEDLAGLQQALLNEF